MISWHPFYGNIPVQCPQPNYYRDYPVLLKQIMSTATEHGFQGRYIADEISAQGDAGLRRICFLQRRGGRQVHSAVVVFASRQRHHRVGGISSSRGMHYTSSQSRQPACRRQRRCLRRAGGDGCPQCQVFTFDRSDGSKLAAIWNDGPAVDDDPACLHHLHPRYAEWQATGIDVLNGFEQELYCEAAGLLIIEALLPKDYPIFIRLAA
jgi:hypothetical protein